MMTVALLAFMFLLGILIFKTTQLGLRAAGRILFGPVVRDVPKLRASVMGMRTSVALSAGTLMPIAARRPSAARIVAAIVPLVLLSGTGLLMGMSLSFFFGFGTIAFLGGTVSGVRRAHRYYEECLRWDSTLAASHARTRRVAIA